MLTDDEIDALWSHIETIDTAEAFRVLVRTAISAVLAKLTAGVEVPEPLGYGFTAPVTVGDIPSLMEKKRIRVSLIAVCSLEAAIQYGASQRLAGQQWLPIESAPHSAAPVLALSESGSMKIETGYWLVNLLHASKVDGENCNYTHWQPLPPYPASPQEQT